MAEGGIPVDLFHNLTYIDHPRSAWTGQIPSHMDGLTRGFDIRHLDRYLTPRGVAVAKTDDTRCSGSFIGLTTQQMFKPRYRDLEHVPVFVRDFDRQIMSRSGTPRGPLFVGHGHHHIRPGNSIAPQPSPAGDDEPYTAVARW